MDSGVSLLVAALDLQLVRLLRQATADDGCRPATPLGPAPSPAPRLHLRPEPVIEPRLHIRPAPRIAPRPVLDAAAPGRAAAAPPIPPEGDGTCFPIYTCPRPHGCSPVQPPWRVLPWKDGDPDADVCGRSPLQNLQKIKPAPRPIDTVHKGTLIDVFL